MLAPKGAFLANAAQASRKDARDAVVAAARRVKGWSGATAYNRGQVLYRVAEVLEGRRAQFVDEIVAPRACPRPPRPRRSTTRSTAGSGTPAGATSTRRSPATRNPVAGPYFNISVPEPTGRRRRSSRRRTRRCSVSCRPSRPRSSPGNTVVVVASERCPLSAISLAEVLATSDVPGGVVNVLTGSPAEIAPWLAAHPDVNALDLAGAGDLDWVDLQIAAADTLKRVLPPEEGPDAAAPSLDRITRVHRDEDGLAHQEHGLNPR